jgi:lipid-A-disaccharide synthase
MFGPRTRAGVEASITAFLAAFAFVPFVPRLVRAAFTNRADRARTLTTIRGGLDARPSAPAEGAAPRALRVFIVAGEPSGDTYAADLAASLARLCPGSTITGVGGPKMSAAGVRLVADLVSDPVMGVWPVVRRTPQFFRLYRDLLVRFDEDPPDVVVGVDYPGLNLRLARAAKARGVPFVMYVAPQVWAWAPWRTRKLARDVSRVLCILPFEEALFRAGGAQAAFVGHPLFEHLAKRTRDDAFGAALRADLGDAPLVALLPGSRRAEVRGNFPILLDAAARVAAMRPRTRFVVPLAAERLRPLVEGTIEAVRGRGVDVVIAPPAKGDDAMAAADAAITVSGTATLHLAAHGTPAVVIYRASAAARALARVLVVSPFFSLPNLLCGEQVQPEFLASPSDAGAIANACLAFMPGGEEREAVVAKLADLRERMTSPGVADRAARWVSATARST